MNVIVAFLASMLAMLLTLALLFWMMPDPRRPQRHNAAAAAIAAAAAANSRPVANSHTAPVVAPAIAGAPLSSAAEAAAARSRLMGATPSANTQPKNVAAARSRLVEAAPAAKTQPSPPRKNVAVAHSLPVQPRSNAAIAIEAPVTFLHQNSGLRCASYAVYHALVGKPEWTGPTTRKEIDRELIQTREEIRAQMLRNARVTLKITDPNDAVVRTIEQDFGPDARDEDVQTIRGYLAKKGLNMHDHVGTLQNAVAYIAHRKDHWYALRREGTEWYAYDSLRRAKRIAITDDFSGAYAVTLVVITAGMVATSRPLAQWPSTSMSII